MALTELFRFTSKALPENTFHVLRFHGTEGINTLFSFTIDLVSTNVSVDAGKILSEKASFVIKRANGQNAVFVGYPARIEQGGFFNGYAFYSVELRPALWKLTQAAQSAIFLKQNVQKVVDDLLAREKFFPVAHEFRLTKKDYPTPEFAMQYGESLYEYILFRLEEQGVYYYFAKDTDTVVFADAPTSHDKAAATLTYSPVSGLEGALREEVLTDFTLTQTPLPRKVVVRSYDWKKPGTVIEGSCDVSQVGIGEVYLANEQIESTAEANRLAKIRAEELIARSRVFTGHGSVPYLRPGVTFTLAGHYNKAFNRDYMVTTITHEGAQESFITLGLGIPLPESVDHLFYRNTFACIESTVPFRPPRTARRARIPGVIRAFIDGAGSGSRAELDEYGRYKVVFPFDLSGRQKGNASCWIRMAQPQVGKDSGMSFPLLPGAEVTVAFVDGNPDRPVITGALPNGETGALTGQGNANFEGIRSPGGNQITINDTNNKQGIAILTAAGLGLTQSDEAGSNTSTLTADDYITASGITSLDWAGVSKTLFTGYKVTSSATKTKLASALWGILLPGILGGVGKCLDTLSNSASKGKNLSLANSLSWGASATKLSAQMSALICDIVTTSILGKGDYGVGLTATPKASRTIVQVKPVTSHLVSQIISWILLRVGSSALSATTIYRNTKTVLNNASSSSSDKNYAKQKAWRDGLVNGLATLLPDITAFITMLVGKASRSELGGISLNAMERNINCCAARTISAHSRQGIFLHTSAVEDDIDPKWGIEDKATDGYGISDFVKNTPFVAVKTSAMYTKASMIKTEATRVETKANAQTYTASDGNAGIRIADDHVKLFADKDGSLSFLFSKNPDAPTLWLLPDGITAQGPKKSSSALLAQDKIALSTSNNTQFAMDKDSINQKSKKVNVSADTIELAAKKAVKAGKFSFEGSKMRCEGGIMELGGAIKIMGSTGIGAKTINLDKSLSGIKQQITNLHAKVKTANAKADTAQAKAQSASDLACKAASAKSLAVNTATSLVMKIE